MRLIPQIQFLIFLIYCYLSLRIIKLYLNRSRERVKMPLVHHFQFSAATIPSVLFVPPRLEINRDNSLSTRTLSSRKKLPFSPENDMVPCLAREVSLARRGIDLELFRARRQDLMSMHPHTVGMIHTTATCTCDFRPRPSPVGATPLRVPPLIQATTRRNDL